MTADPLNNLRIQRNGNSVMVRIAGPINRQTISSFQQRLEGVLRERCFTLTLDLGAAEYLDSDGVRWLQQLQAALHSANGDVRLTVREGSRIHRTLCLLQLDRSFSVASYPDGPDSQDAPPPYRLTTA